MIGRAPSHPASEQARRDQLKAADDQAWRAYHDAVWDLNGTAESRSEAFVKAIETMGALLAYDRKIQMGT